MRAPFQLLQDAGRVLSEKAWRSRVDLHRRLIRNGFAVLVGSFLDVPCQFGSDPKLLKPHFVNPTKPFENLILLSLQSKTPIDAEQVNPTNEQIVRDRIRGNAREDNQICAFGQSIRTKNHDVPQDWVRNVS